MADKVEYTAAQSGHAKRVMDALSKAKCEHVHFMFGPPCGHCYATAHDAIATAIAEGFAAGVAQERGRCAKVAEDYDGDGHKSGQYTQLGDSAMTQHDIVAAIRAGEVRG